MRAKTKKLWSYSLAYLGNNTIAETQQITRRVGFVGHLAHLDYNETHLRYIGAWKRTSGNKRLCTRVEVLQVLPISVQSVLVDNAELMPGPG